MSRVSLVTTCYNEMASVERWLEDLARQTEQPDEISIVDAGSTDGTVDILQEWAKTDKRVRLAVRPGCTVAQGRNHAIRCTNAEIIVSTDMGCFLDRLWFANMIEPFSFPNKPDVVAGNYSYRYPDKNTALIRASKYCFGQGPRFGGPTFLASSRSIAFRKQVWYELNGYSEDLTYAGDDTVFALQIDLANFKIAYAENAVVKWLRHECYQQYWKEAYRYAYGNGEAGIMPLWFINLQRSVLRTAVFSFISFLKTIRVSSRVASKALLKFDIAAAIAIFVLQYGRMINTYNGYADGYMNGLSACIACRNRLAKKIIIV